MTEALLWHQPPSSRRCIKPTHKEAPRHFEGNLVMKQLECVIPLLEVWRGPQNEGPRAVAHIGLFGFAKPTTNYSP